MLTSLLVNSSLAIRPKHAGWISGTKICYAYCILVKASCILEFGQNVLIPLSSERITKISGKVVLTWTGVTAKSRYRNLMQGNSASAAADDSSHSDEFLFVALWFAATNRCYGSVGIIMGNHYSRPILHGDNSTHVFLYLRGIPKPCSFIILCRLKRVASEAVLRQVVFVIGRIKSQRNE